MSDLWFLGSADSWADGGFTSPDPVTQGDTSWTWDVEFVTSSNQWTYARTSVNSFASIDGGSSWIFSGIVSYRTRDANGVDTLQPAGQWQGSMNGVADYMNDTGVVDVTFGWGIEGDNYCFANINMEVWVSH